MDRNFLNTLEKVKCNTPCIVKKFQTDSKLNIDKLYNIGITENAEITPLFGSIFGGARAYFVKGSVVALRDTDAKNIFIYQSE